MNENLFSISTSIFTECDVNCHKKCEKLAANLCGVNQKLIVEALASVRRENQGALSCGLSRSTSNSIAVLAFVSTKSETNEVIRKPKTIKNLERRRFSCFSSAFLIDRDRSIAEIFLDFCHQTCPNCVVIWLISLIALLHTLA
jgi:hypothetical protein